MTYRVLIEPTAERGIRAAVRWFHEHRPPTAAAKWYNGLIKKVGTLKSHPLRGPIAAENEKFPEEIRELLYGRRGNVFRIIYAIRGDEVHVLYLHHAAMDELEP